MNKVRAVDNVTMLKDPIKNINTYLYPHYHHNKDLHHENLDLVHLNPYIHHYESFDRYEFHHDIVRPDQNIYSEENPAEITYE